MVDSKENYKFDLGVEELKKCFSRGMNVVECPKVRLHKRQSWSCIVD